MPHTSPGSPATDSSETTLTFVFTDIAGSTRLLQTLGAAYDELLARHDDIIRGAAVAEGGRAFGSEGDAQKLVFPDASAAVRAAVAAQRGLASQDWPDGVTVSVRMGIHTGQTRRLGDDYVGMPLHETARIAAAAHGGQVLVSAATVELARDGSLQDIDFRDLGQHGLKDIERPVRIFQVAADGLAVEFPPPRTLKSVGARLPVQLTPFVERPEVDDVAAAVGSSRLVTLTGPGGTGKTRLAVETAAAVAPRFPDGTWFVALEAIEDPDLVASEIARVMGVPAGAGTPVERIIGSIEDRAVLLVLDNLEQVIDAGATISRLLSACPGLSVLATSRIVLGIYGEQSYPVPPLPVPPPGASDAAAVAHSGAVHLFVERAMAARRDFALTDANATVVADIVRQVDGLPLAIELAAARLRMLPVEALRDRLGDRLALLTSGARDAPGRQRTLRGTIEWSHELLDAPDRRLFARFSVLAGGAGIEHAERVCGPASDLGREVFDGLDSLAQQSLVRIVDDEGAPRCAMLATIREYAIEQLAASGEGDAVHRRHAQTYLALAEEAEPHLLGPQGPRWYDRLEREHDNIRAALDWIVAADEAELGLRLVAACWRFWQARGHLIEADERIGAVLSLPSAPSQDAIIRSRAESAAGGVCYWRSRPEATHRHYSAALEAAREADDAKRLADALYDFGFAATPDVRDQMTRYRTGLDAWREALALYEEIGDRGGIASTTWALAMSAATQGDVDEGGRLAEQALELSQELGDPFRIGWASHLVGMWRMSSGDEAGAVPAFLQALDIFDGAGDETGILLLMADTAGVAQLREDPEQYWRFIGAALRIRDDSGIGLLDETTTVEFMGWRLVTEPEEPEPQAWTEAGRSMSRPEVIAAAREYLAGR